MILMLQLGLGLVAVAVALSGAYLLLMTLLSAPLRPAAPSSRRLRFDVIVPAHDEASVIERTVRSLRGLDWPAERFRVVVVADNCRDDTAALARAAGAEVWERQHEQQRGKGHALAFAFARSLDQGRADAVVVVDADTVVSRDLLEACARRLEAGAQAVQVHYAVLNGHASWRTRLMTIAFAAVHVLRMRARERLAVSAGLRGNGMAFSHILLRRYGYDAYSVAEDLEYGIRLGLAGVRVHFAEEALVQGEMVPGERASRSQRQRWEGGRFLMIRTQTGPLLRAAMRRRSGLCLELALDLLVLPLGYVALLTVALLLVSLPLALQWPGFGWLVAVAMFGLAAIVLYVLRGWSLSGTGRAGLLDLIRAPAFVIWKLLLMLRPRRDGAWVRTQRDTL